MASVESLQNAVRMLVGERQALHERQAGHQQQLSVALIDRYLPRADRDAA